MTAQQTKQQPFSIEHTVFPSLDAWGVLSPQSIGVHACDGVISLVKIG